MIYATLVFFVYSWRGVNWRTQQRVKKLVILVFLALEKSFVCSMPVVHPSQNSIVANESKNWLNIRLVWFLRSISTHFWWWYSWKFGLQIKKENADLFDQFCLLSSIYELKNGRWKPEWSASVVKPAMKDQAKALTKCALMTSRPKIPGTRFWKNISEKIHS